MKLQLKLGDNIFFAFRWCCRFFWRTTMCGIRNYVIIDVCFLFIWFIHTVLHLLLFVCILILYNFNWPPILTFSLFFPLLKLPFSFVVAVYQMDTYFYYFSLSTAREKEQVFWYRWYTSIETVIDTQKRFQIEIEMNRTKGDQKVAEKHVCYQSSKEVVK